MRNEDSVKAMWSRFQQAHPELAEGRGYTAWHFCDNEQDANELAQLVLEGRKRATAGSLWAYEAEQEALPEPGDLSIVIDWAGEAVCIIRTLAVEVTPFDSVSAEFAATEGEGDCSLEYWRDGHQRYFTRELESLGMQFEPTMPVVCERFEVVFPG